MAPCRFETAVQQLRNRLIRCGPVSVAAAEDGVGDAGEGVGGQCLIAQPGRERGRVLRWFAVVGGADDQHGALRRQIRAVVVERGDGDLVAALDALAAEPVGDAFGRAQVRPEQHQQRGAMTVGRSARVFGREVLSPLVRLRGW